MSNSVNALKDLENILNFLTPFDDKERDDIEFIISRLQTTPDILQESCIEGHVTGSALLLDVSSGRLLLHFHKKVKKWLQFGGHMDGEVNPAETALREVKEESGIENIYFFPKVTDVLPIDIEIQSIPEYNGKPAHLHYDFRYLIATDRPEQLNTGLENESNEFAWVSITDVDDPKYSLETAAKRLIKKSYRIWALNK
jgi:8-oxo-dGTP pyrophosphatase MutT (NUDIX family)